MNKTLKLISICDGVEKYDLCIGEYTLTNYLHLSSQGKATVEDAENYFKDLYENYKNQTFDEFKKWIKIDFNKYPEFIESARNIFLERSNNIKTYKKLYV